MKNTLLLSAVFMFFLPSISEADMFAPSPSCFKPSKPYQFNSQYEVDNFMSEVEMYKRCINDFVEEQQEAIRKHSEAAEEAITEWNNFVKYELN